MPTRDKGYPAHEECVEVEIDLALGEAGSEAIGADLSSDYVQENADYRT